MCQHLLVLALFVRCITAFLLSFSWRKLTDLCWSCFGLPNLLHALKHNICAIGPFLPLILLECILLQTYNFQRVLQCNSPPCSRSLPQCLILLKPLPCAVHAEKAQIQQA